MKPLLDALLTLFLLYTSDTLQKTSSMFWNLISNLKLVRNYLTIIFRKYMESVVIQKVKDRRQFESMISNQIIDEIK